MRSRPSASAQAAPKQPFAAMDLSSLPRGRRDPRRLKALKLASPLIALVLLAGLWMVGQYLWTSAARSQFLDGKEAKAEASFSRQAAVTSVYPEPWVARYNLGTTLLARGDVEQGISLLQRAFEDVPKAVRRDDGGIEPYAYECAVRVNLSAGIEMQGDALEAEGAAEQAAVLYQEALDWVSPCELQSSSAEGEPAGQGPDEGEESPEQSPGDGEVNQGNEAGDRLRQKLNQSDSEGQDSGQGGQDSSEEQSAQREPAESTPFNGETPEQKERREKLQEQNRRHSEQQREKEESSGWGGGGGW